MRVAVEAKARGWPERCRLLQGEHLRLRIRLRPAIDEARHARAAAVLLAEALRRVAVEVDAPEVVGDGRDVGIDRAVGHGIAQVLAAHAPLARLLAIRRGVDREG